MIKSMIKPTKGRVLVKPIEIIQPTNLIYGVKSAFSEGDIVAVSDDSDFKVGETIIYNQGLSLQGYELVHEMDIIGIKYE